MFSVFQWDMYSVMKGNGVCLLLNVQAANTLNANGLCFPSSLQMADCGGMPQVDQVRTSVFV